MLGAHGISEHKPRRIQPRPIKSAQVLKTPTKMSRSGTVGKALPAKVYGSNNSKSHHSAPTRGSHTPRRRSPGKENTPPHEQTQTQTTANSCFESMPPPTPPAKDTPPEFRLPVGPPSPLRRAPSHDDLRESYGAAPGRGTQVQLPFPMFALSLSPPKTAIHGTGGESPSKFLPFSAEDYTKLIEGEALGWRFADDEGYSEVKEGNFSAPLVHVKDSHGMLQLPLSSRSDDDHYNERLSRRLSPLPPRFYSPSNRSVRLFKDGESPSQNVSGKCSFPITQRGQLWVRASQIPHPCDLPDLPSLRFSNLRTFPLFLLADPPPRQTEPACSSRRPSLKPASSISAKTPTTVRSRWFTRAA